MGTGPVPQGQPRDGRKEILPSRANVLPDHSYKHASVPNTESGKTIGAQRIGATEREDALRSSVAPYGPMFFLRIRYDSQGSSRIRQHAAHRRKRGELTTRDTVSHTSAVAGRTRLPWGRRERQTDGSAAGGHPRFFRNSIVFRSAPQPTIPASPDARSRKPSPRTTAAGMRRLSRAPRLCKIAHQVSWRLGPVRFRQASPPADDGDEHEGPPQKMRMAPCRTSSPVPTLGFACTGPPAARWLKHRRTIIPLPCNQIGGEPFLNTL